nr:MAG TPA: hypothetical protein [Caudoviricetes sp.]DAL95809.1 MAG TPA: hypothetical protein [Caudoviricetes sp.]
MHSLISQKRCYINPKSHKVHGCIVFLGCFCIFIYSYYLF